MKKPQATGRVEFRLSQAANARDYLEYVGIEGFNRLNSGRTLAGLANSFARNDNDRLTRGWRDREMGQKLRPMRGNVGKRRLNLFGLAINAF